MLGIFSGLAGLAVAPAANADHCKVLSRCEHPAEQRRGRVPAADVTATAQTGGATHSSWANSSSRVLGTRLKQTRDDQQHSSGEVTAVDSDVVPVPDGRRELRRRWLVMYCKKGLSAGSTCPRTITTRPSSFILPARILSDESLHHAQWADRGLGSNPCSRWPRSRRPSTTRSRKSSVAPATISTTSPYQERRRIQPLEPDRLDDQVAAASSFNETCTDADRYVDYMRISKRFEIDLNQPVNSSRRRRLRHPDRLVRSHLNWSTGTSGCSSGG